MELSLKKTRGFLEKEYNLSSTAYKKTPTDNLFSIVVYTKIKNLGSESKVIYSFPDFFVIQNRKNRQNFHFEVKNSIQNGKNR